MRAEVRAKLRELKPFMVLTGMALGFDQWVAEICIEEEIPFCACIPFEGQEKKWPKRSQERYHELLAKARVQVVVSEGGYHPGKLHARNHFMVDNSDVLIAAWNGDTEGGTFRCVEYANKVGREVIRLECLKKEGS